MAPIMPALYAVLSTIAAHTEIELRRRELMTEYAFSLKYRLPPDDVDVDAIVERLGEAGCTDALVGIGIGGRLALEFAREAANARDAFRSALEDVRSAIPGAALVEASPDLVGLSDVADLLGVTRQNVRKLMLAHSDFPLPLHEGSASIWHLSDVLGWLDGRKKGRATDKALREAAAAALEVNLAREARRFTKVGSTELQKLVETARPTAQ